MRGAPRPQGGKRHEEPTSLKAEVESNRGTSAGDAIGSDGGRVPGQGTDDDYRHECAYRQGRRGAGSTMILWT